MIYFFPSNIANWLQLLDLWHEIADKCVGGMVDNIYNFTLMSSAENVPLPVLAVPVSLIV